jgi:excisionase family DNA binding protein
VYESAGSTPGEDYIAPAEAARLLSVSARTITRWAREGRIPSITTLGGHRRFPRHVVEALAAGQLAEMEATRPRA